MPDKDPETIFDDPQDNSVVEPEEGLEEVEEQSEEEVIEEEEESGEQSFLKGTTFKKGEDLLKAYNELRSEFTRRNQENSEMRDLLKQVLPFLTKSQKQEINQNPEDFMRTFVSDPRGTLLNLITEASQNSIKGIQSELGQVRANMEINEFRAAHPEFQESDIEGFMKIMDAYPEVRSRKDRMEVWFKLYKTENPEIGNRTTEQKKSLEQGVSDAKRAATLGGKKSSIPYKEGGDEFDEVLKLWNDRNAKFQR